MEVLTQKTSRNHTKRSKTFRVWTFAAEKGNRKWLKQKQWCVTDLSKNDFQIAPRFSNIRKRRKLKQSFLFGLEQEIKRPTCFFRVISTKHHSNQHSIFYKKVFNFELTRAFDAGAQKMFYF